MYRVNKNRITKYITDTLTHLCFNDLDVVELRDLVPRLVGSLLGVGDGGGGLFPSSGSSLRQEWGLLLFSVSLETVELRSSKTWSDFVSFAAGRLLVLPVFFKAISPETKKKYILAASSANQTQVQSLPASESFLLFSALSNNTLNSSKLSWPSLLESSWKKTELSLVFLHFGPIYLRINWKTGSDNQRPLRVNNLLLGSGDVQTFKLTFAISSINSFSDNFFVNFLKSFWVI